MNAFIKLLIVQICLIPLAAVGVPFPYLENIQILKCEAANGYTCGSAWYYVDSTILLDQVPAVPPDPSGGYILQAISIHCNVGSGPLGIPFSECAFTAAGHAPSITDCRLRSLESWELTLSSICSLDSRQWIHTGADTGGECVLFVQSKGWTSFTARTIYGQLDPAQVANSGSTYCEKPLPPDVICNIILPPTLDHGVISTNAHSVVGLEGTVDCGAKPVITILGGGSKIQLSPGVTTDITTQMVGTDHIRLTSTLDAINAEPGDHRGSVVVIASPY